MVYRPPKHKPAPGMPPSRPSSDPISGPTSHADDPDEILKGDDRNLVSVDENYSSGDIEDTLWLFWQRHSKLVWRALMAVCLALIAWQSWNLYQKHVISNLQAEYQAANGAPGLLAFAGAHPDEILGKLAVLEAADALYKEGKFKEAGDAYSKASSVWAGDEKGQRARLGWAMCLLASGDIAGAHQHLEGIYSDSGSGLENFRAEAAFDNAVIYAQNGDVENSNIWVDRAKSLNSSPTWAAQAKTFADILPLLSDIKLVSGTYTPSLDSGAGPENFPATNIPVTKEPSSPAANTTPTPASTVKPAATATAPAAASFTPPAPAKSATTGTSFDLSRLNGAPAAGTSSK